MFSSGADQQLSTQLGLSFVIGIEHNILSESHYSAAGK